MAARYRSASTAGLHHGAGFALAGGPNGTVLANSVSELHGQTVFVQDSPNHQGPGYVTSTASLGN
jgi:hypothetical protein